MIFMIVRCMNRYRHFRSECILQYIHSRKAELITQLVNAIADVAKVFGNKRQILQAFVKRFEKCRTRARLPFPVNRCFLVGGYFPKIIKCPEMVEPDQIKKLQIFRKPA